MIFTQKNRKSRVTAGNVGMALLQPFFDGGFPDFSGLAAALLYSFQLFLKS